MTKQIRRSFFLLSATALALVFYIAYSRMEPLGYSRSAYGDTLNAITVPERHITDVVTAINFDIRGFDTLGEEFILFTSVMGVALLMRRQKNDPRGHHEDKAEGRVIPPASDAVRVTALLLLGPTVVFALYVISHGQLTPGGGFQGGVILSSAAMLVYLCAEYRQFRRMTPPRLVEILEAFGAAAYILIGAACVGLGGLFLQNLLPKGAVGSLFSGGIVPLIDLGVGLEVGGGLTLALAAYLEELVEEKEE